MTKLSFKSLLFLWFLTTTALFAESTAPNLTSFIRYTPKYGQLETSIVTMKSPSGVTLDLVSAVHVGSPAYYQSLNQKFEVYDAVLYELILPDDMAGKQLPSQLETGSGIGGIQGMLARSMGLTTQLDKVDYSPKNFVHADLTQSGLSKKMAERQESLMSYFMKLMGSSASIDEKALGVSEAELAELDVMAIISGKTTAKDQKLLRKLFGSVLSSSGGVLSALGDTTIIAERNKAALKVLETQSKAGKKYMALYYGAAHMPDVKAQLEKRGWKTTNTDWVTAWKN